MSSQYQCNVISADIYCCQLSVEPIKQRFVEPIFQAYIKKPNLKVIHCLSNKCDNCLNEYFEKNLQLSYNQRFQNHKDTLEMGRPNAVVTSPNITINDDQMMHMQDDAIKKLKNEKKEIRKRYALMQMNDSVFILGGYIVDAKTGQKKAPENDYL
ncbi:unnamed protein product [Rotaria sp. Silwood1]|nr:unnamed protein product [Rotaria sp. Silwood1]